MSILILKKIQLRAVFLEKNSLSYEKKIKFPFKIKKQSLNRNSKKVNSKQGYVLLENDKPVGLLRYNLFWDNTSFCTMLFIDWNNQKKGYGKELLEYWEKDMKSQGYDFVLTSTQVDETAQHFYRKLGYKDCGGLIIDIPNYEQPMEIFLIKAI